MAVLLDEAEGTTRTCWSFRLPVAKSTVTHHFKVLREAGLVLTVDRGNRREVELRRDDLNRRFPGLLELIRNEQTYA